VVGRMTQIASGGTNYLSQVAYNSAQMATGFTYGNGVQASFGYTTISNSLRWPIPQAPARC
jgi:hypothetical protein